MGREKFVLSYIAVIGLMLGACGDDGRPMNSESASATMTAARVAAPGDGGLITTPGSFSARPPHTMRVRSSVTSRMTSNEDTTASR